MTPEQFDALRDRATRPRRTVPVILDGDLRQLIQELILEREALEETTAKPAGGKRLGTRSAPPRLAEIDHDLDVLYELAEASTLQVVIEGLAGTPFDTLRSQHPARDDDPRDKLWRFNTETGRDPLIRACAIGYRGDGGTIHPWSPPVLDSEGKVLKPGQLDWLLGFVTDYQRDLLFLSALNMCRGDDAVPLRPGRSETPTSDAG